MNGLLLIIYVISIALACMVLALAITFSVFHKAKWCSWYIVFQACIMATTVLGCIRLISSSFFSPSVSVVFDYIFGIMTHATMGVVCTLMPYFLKWILNTSWTGLHKVAFFGAGIGYFAVGLVSILTHNETLAVVIQSIIFLLVCLYSILLLWIKIKNVPNENSRGVCLAAIITSLCMIPLVVVSFIFRDVRSFSYPSYVMVLSIVMMVYFFIRFNLDSRRNQSDTLQTNEFDKFKVTDRELSVIKLVCNGLTNKEIASELNISVNTVNNHVANIFEKVGARSRVDLLKMMKSDPWN